MPMRDRFAALVLLAALAVPVCAEAGGEEKRRPNILFILLDDFGWKDASFMGSDFYETPHLDRLASEGMVFTDAYSCASNCAPARASLLSGQYTPRHEIYNVGTGMRGNPAFNKLRHVPGTDTLDRMTTTWAQVLQGAGYRTGLFGKWHLSADPIPYGFDVNIGGTHSGGPPGGYYAPHGKVPGLGGAPEGEYLTDRLSDEVIAFMRSSGERPWCVYLTHFAVHTPIEAKKDLVAKYAAKEPGKLHRNVAMATMVQAVDDGVGRIVGALEAMGATENTVIFFYSDNGGYGPATDMDPLKGYKGTYYEGGIRVPFFVKWPGVVKGGQESAVPVIGVDMFPTLCEIAGAELPRQALDGVSLVGLLRGDVDTLGERALFWHFPAYLQSYGGDYTMEQRDPLFRSRPCGIVRVGNWKLHEYFEDGGLELYDLGEDIGETRDLSGEMPEKVKELREVMVRWREEIGAPVPSEANPKYDAAAEAEALGVAGKGTGAGKRKKGAGKELEK